MREEEEDERKEEFPGLNESLSKVRDSVLKRTAQVKFGVMSPSMVHGFVSPLMTITQTRPQTLENIKKKNVILSRTGKPFALSPVVKLEHEDEEERRSLKGRKNELLERADIDADESINEELLLTQHMSELSMIDEDDGTEWLTLIGILFLVLTLAGHSMSGVVANLVPAPSGYVMLAQKSGFVCLLAAIPAYFECHYYPQSVDWEDLLKFSSLFYCLTTTSLNMFWQAFFLNNV